MTSANTNPTLQSVNEIGNKGAIRNMVSSDGIQQLTLATHRDDSSRSLPMPSYAIGKPWLETLDHSPPRRNVAQSILQILDLIAFNGSIANSLGDKRLEQGGVDHSFCHGLTLTDHDSGRTERYDFGEHAIVEEHLWIAKPGHGPERDERDAWLMGTHFDSRAKVTKLSVFDARSLADGPLAVASLPYWLPLGFHGNFQAASGA